MSVCTLGPGSSLGSGWRGSSADLPALQLRVGPLAGAALAGVGGVDRLLRLGQSPVALGVRVDAAAPLRDGTFGRRLGSRCGRHVNAGEVDRVKPELYRFSD